MKNKKLTEFTNYLHKIGHSETTIRSYGFACRHFLKEVPSPQKMTYKDVVDYLFSNPKTLRTSQQKAARLYAIKKYFYHLIDKGVILYHPCRNLHIRNNRDKRIIIQDLFSSAELNLLLTRTERYELLVQRNKVLISLLIYQGLTSMELMKLDVKNIDLDTGRIYIKGGKNNRRYLRIETKQSNILEEYLTTGRQLLSPKKTDALILGKLGNRLGIETINYIVTLYKPLFPDRNLCPAKIRQSVIANWLNEKKLPLEEVQLLSGQKRLSTTQRYRQVNLNEQIEMINKWFPI